ncbi:MAG: MBL fold metallo-hydrolase [Myxococcota bacterium]|jgi:metallo-beta-lactamase family protein|nr:MBL fold metallo-hydrolase [Myxococcota bacterium]
MGEHAERVTFLGAAGTVTGSRFLVETGRGRFLVDCGQFQGLKELRLRNWAPFPVEPRSIDAVVLTHAHLDHSGYLPRLAKDGFRGPVLGTAATTVLTKILLADAAHLEEENADYANRKRTSRHQPALPLFTTEDAARVCAELQPYGYGRPVEIPGTGARVTFLRAGHIPGSAILVVELPSGKKIVFSGDLGRYDYPILRDPAVPGEAELVVMESTYGDKRHEDLAGTRRHLVEVIQRSVERGGVLLIPSFAVGRTQTLLSFLRELEDDGEIPILPVVVDSPMATEVSRVTLQHQEEHDEETREQTRRGGNRAVYPHRLRYTSSVAESKELNQVEGGMILISASGMMTGGRILHHASLRLPDERNTLLVVGYQAIGTRGRTLLDGARELKIFGQYVPVRAEIAQIDGLSAHADSDELLRWLGGLSRPPRLTCLVHGEPDSLAGLAERIEQEKGWNVLIPEQEQSVPV